MTLACHKGQESGDVDGGLTNNFLTFVPGVYMKFWYFGLNRCLVLTSTSQPFPWLKTSLANKDHCSFFLPGKRSSASHVLLL